MEEIIEKANNTAKLSTDTKIFITKGQYLEIIMEDWQNFLLEEKKDLLKLFKKYDADGNGVMSAEEFNNLIRDVEPDMDIEEACRLFLKVSHNKIY